MGKAQARKEQKRQDRANPPWTPFIKADYLENFTTGEKFSTEGMYEQVFFNSRYQVNIRDVGEGFVHLSIKRRDKGVIHSWRDLQRIKNEIVGPECEGIELYPKESRLVDGANQYHLFVCTDPTFEWPFGWNQRLVSEESFRGSVQEPFEEDNTPPDLKTAQEIEEIMARGVPYRVLREA